MQTPIVNEPAPEERLAKVFIAFLKLSELPAEALNYLLAKFPLHELAVRLSPHLQLELLEVAHQERVLCLADFYNLREKLVERERITFQKMSELHARILASPEAKLISPLPEHSTIELSQFKPKERL